jgi:hypothetical protein
MNSSSRATDSRRATEDVALVRATPFDAEAITPIGEQLANFGRGIREVVTRIFICLAADAHAVDETTAV